MTRMGKTKTSRKQRIVFKFGTGILTKRKGVKLDVRQIARLVTEVASLVKSGHECLIVSSGSVGAGMMALGIGERPADTPARQACAAVGQSRLMRHYEVEFSKHKLLVAQLLLTHQDMDSRTRYTNARNTLEHLLQHGHVVPIINENDTVAVEELRFGDNDRLSAEVAILAGADQLVLLTSVDGLMDASGKRVAEVTDFDKALTYVTGESGALSVGGMASKILSARLVVEHGIPCTIASGFEPGIIPAVAKGATVGTRFPAHSGSHGRKEKKRSS